MKFEEYQAPREIEVTIGPGILATVAVPHAVDNDDYHAMGYAPPTLKMALILHGQGGHRDYCYQKRLAHALAKELGVYSLRIDFRGCGNSADNANDKVGRVISQDVADIQACAEWITDSSKHGLGVEFTLSLIIAHSRGAVAMFLWAIEQNQIAKLEDPSKAIIVPNLVNCSLRFRLWTVIDRYPILSPEFDSLPQRCLRHGKMTDVPIPRQELLELAKPDMTRVKELPLDWSTLCIYGLEDTIVPIEDFAYYTNYLNRGYYSNKLEIIPRADHNFFGTVPIESESDAAEFNPDGYPLNRRKLVNYNYEVVDRILLWLQPHQELKRFVALLYDIGRFPRWKQVEGILNFRDLGGWKVAHPRYPEADGNSHSYYVVPNLVFRCALMTTVTDAGVQAIKRLGVVTVFDLRSHGEAKDDGVHEKLAAAGITRIHSPVFTDDDYSPELIAMRYQNLMTLWSTYINVYEKVLDEGWGAYKTIFEYIRDDGRPFLFHCTAGKDRTGVLAMLILLLCGVDHHTIAREYELTTVGLQPDHAKIKAKFVDTVDKLKLKMGEAGDALEAAIAQGRANWTLEEDGFNNLISLRYEAMLDTISMFHQKYGGIVSYMRDKFGFTEDDIRQIHARLVITDPQQDGFTTENHLKWTARCNEKAKI
ncbi:tyrosine-protein phosphatase [Kocuria palustris]|nr:tyrosine-protein phosphatase [Kocuria palustris]